MAKGKEKEGSGFAMAGLRDIKEDIVKGLGDSLPSLGRFFQTLSVPVWSTDAALEIIKNAQESDGPERQWLHINNRLVEELHRRYDALLQESDQQAATLSHRLTEAQAVAESYRELALANASNSSSCTETDRDGAMPHPTPFSGDEKDTTKRTQAFRTWRIRIEARWANRQHEFSTERAKILYAAALLEGTAALGVNDDLEKITSNLENPAAWRWQSGAEFVAHLARKFATLDLVADAENKLRKLAQEGKYSIFTDFLTEFTNLTDVYDWDDTPGLRALKERISVALKKLVACQVTQPDRSDFAAWVRIIHQLAVNQESMEQSRKGNNHNNGYQGGKAKDVDAMDVDGMNLNAAKIHPQERERRYNDGLYYNCGQEGHVSKDCRNSPR